MNKMENAVKTLLEEKPFYAHFFLNSKVVFDKFGVATAAAGIKDNTIMLVFNTGFVNSLSVKETAAIIEHEILHILFEHVNIYHNKDSSYDHHVANIAMDLAINQYINDLPKGGVTLEGINSGLKLNLPAGETWKFYYEHLMHKKDKMKKYCTVDDHEAKVGDVLPESVSKVIVRNSVDKSMKEAKGNVPKEVITAYGDLATESKVPWQQLLANFISRHTTTTKIATRKKMNRRYGLDQPGKKHKKELILGVCLDSSGSVSDEAFQQFLAEVVRLSPLAYKTHVIDADCEIQDITTVSKNKKVELKRSGRGGTAYQPAIDKCVELKCNVIIYFGDFDTADQPQDPKVPFLWVGVGSSPKPGDFGYEIRL